MILIILGLGLVLRLISLDQSLWLDEGINVMAARSFSLFGMITQYAVADFHPPGWFVILWSWGKLFGYSESVVRLPSVLFGVLTIYVSFLIGKKLVSKDVGLLSALLLGINPLHIYYSQEARMYALAALAVSLNMLFFIELAKGEKGNKRNGVNLGKIFYILSNIFVFLSDYVAYLIFPAQLIFLLLFKRESLKRWFGYLAVSLLAGIWWMPVFLKQIDVGASASANLPTWKFVAGGFDFKTIPLTLVKFIIGRISLADKMLYAVLLAPVVSMFGFLVWRGQNRLGGLKKKLLIVWVLVPLALASVISIIIPVYNYFRVLYLIPAFVILIAAGILSFSGKIKYAFFTAIVSIEIFCALVYLLNPSYQREDWRGLVKFLNGVNSRVVLFESSGTLPPFDYYNKDNLNAKGALKDFPAKDRGAVEDLGNLVKEKEEVYLVDYMVEISDPERLAAKELTDLGYSLIETTDFHGVGFVYKYVKDTGI